MDTTTTTTTNELESILAQLTRLAEQEDGAGAGVTTAELKQALGWGDARILRYIGLGLERGVLEACQVQRRYRNGIVHPVTAWRAKT